MKDQDKLNFFLYIRNFNFLKGQFIRYSLVAITAFVVDFGLLFLFTTYLHIFYIFSATFSFLISSIVNYLLSVKWVFLQRSNLSITMEIKIFYHFILMYLYF